MKKFGVYEKCRSFRPDLQQVILLKGTLQTMKYKGQSSIYGALVEKEEVNLNRSRSKPEQGFGF